MDYQPPPFFRRVPRRSSAWGFLCVLAVLLMVLERFFDMRVPAVRSCPAHVSAAAASRSLRGARSRGRRILHDTGSLKQENEQLKAKQLQAANELLTVQALRSETRPAEALARGTRAPARESTLARSSIRARSLLAQGDHRQGPPAGHPAGTAVIDDLGVVGQVTRVYPLLSEVTLITTRSRELPIQVVRNGCAPSSMAAAAEVRST